MKKIIPSVLSAILVILSFPKTSFWFLAWISLVPLILSIRNEKPIKAFFYGTFTGLAAYCGILYWLVPTFSSAGEPKTAGIAVLFALSFYLAIYYGLFCLSLCLLPAVPYIFPAIFWVSLELIRTRLFTGFPWALLGYSQWNNLPAIQISEFTGVYGVSFFIVLVNLSIADIITKKQKILSFSNLFAFSTVLLSLSFGVIKLTAYRPAPDVYRVSILQGNVDQYKKWDEKYEREIINKYSLLAASSATTADLIVWPESSVPGFLRYDKKLYGWISDTAKKTGKQNLVASNDYKNGKLYNSAFLMTSDGQITGEYSKVHLVPFGEYMPLRNFLSKFINVVNEIGEFTPGENYNIVNSSAGKIGVNICFEAIFPNEVRKSVKTGAEIVVNLTNDAWYLKTAAPYQHFTVNVLRAVENRRCVVRAANTGISGFIDPAGRIKSKTNIFETTALTGTVVPNSNLTFYSEFGDVFAYMCAMISIILLIHLFLKSHLERAGLTFGKKFYKL